MSTTAERTAVPPAVTTPASIETPMGVLEFNDGYPTSRAPDLPRHGCPPAARANLFFYTATGITPAMCMRLTNVGSQYLMANVDANSDQVDGAKTYRVRLPKDIPAARFWSFTVYDNQTRSMLQTPQVPARRQPELPSPAAEPEPDGSTVVYFSPTQPDGVADGNWIQTDPDKSWFVALRLYSPLQSFFDKTWRPGELEPVG